MGLKQSIVVGLLVFVLMKRSLSFSADSYSPRNSGLRQRKYLNQALKDNEPPPQDNTEFVRRVTSKRFVRDEKAWKHSNVAIENGVVEQNRNAQQNPTNKVQAPVQNITEGPKVSQTPHLLADYGILGISDDEDSAKWAATEIKKIPAKPNSNEKQFEKLQTRDNNTQNVTTAQNTSRNISPQLIAHIFQTTAKIANAHKIRANGTNLKDLQAFSKIIATGVNTTMAMRQSSKLPQSGEAKDPENNNNIIATGTKSESLIQNATIKAPSTNVQLTGQTDAIDNHTTVQPSFAQGEGIKAHNDTKFDVTVAQINSKGTQGNISGNNNAVSLEKTTKGTTSTPAALLSQSNQTTNNELFPSNIVAENNEDADEKAASLSVNDTGLRKGQSFDLQMPTSISSKGTYQDAHFHLAPNENLSSEYSSETLQNNTGDFLNETLHNINVAEEANGKLLQKLNSDIVTARVEPLTSNANSGIEVTDKAFREETPAGRTFADNVLEDSSHQALLNRKVQRVQQVQQDENLARALNQSSVSSIIFSANDAISNTDLQVFSKKSAQGRLGAKDKEHRNKRSNYLHRLSERDRKHKKLHQKATARQVINLGNHFLWFGGQEAADANGFPRHNTAAENPQYNVNSYVSNVLNSGNEKEGASATKGYKALQNALSSMESNQEEEGDSAQFQYGIPGNREWQDTNQEHAPTSVLIQDDAGKSVYQGIVNIVKLNNTKSNDNVSSEVGSQKHDASIGQEKEVSNKTETHFQAEHDSSRDTNINNESAIYINSSKPIISLQDGGNTGNQTETADTKEPTGHADDTNSTVSKEVGADQNQAQEIKDINQAEQNQILTGKMQSEYQDQEKPLSEAQPSAIIKQLSRNSNEPETYHVVVNDAGKKITNANGHVTVIISGPTAAQASMPAENTLLIPQTGSSLENANISSNENPFSPLSDDQSSFTQSDQLSRNMTNETQGIFSQSSQAANNASLNATRTNGSLSLLQEDALSALKISEDIEGQLNKGQPQVEIEQQSQKASASGTNPNETVNAKSTESLMQEGHHFVKVGQDLTGGVDGLQMEEVSRPNIQEEQQQENQNLPMEPPAGRYLDGLEKSLEEQSHDVPTLNIVLDPSHKIGGSLSVGGKVVPIASGKVEGDSAQFVAAHKQQLDCHADPKNGKTTVTILTCQKKQNLPNIPQSLSKQDQMFGGPALQLDQVMNVLNDQVKATINKEMITESKDIQKMLTGMTGPSSTLMDADEASSQSEAPHRSSLIGPDETYTSPPEDEEPGRWESRRPHHRTMHNFGFPHHLGFHNYLGFLNRLPISPHRRHFWGLHHHSHPFVVMAHKDHSGEGYWDYKHNIFIPREEDDDDEEEDHREKHWTPWAQQGHRRGNWLMAHPPFHHRRFSPPRRHDLFHLRLPTIFGRSGPWKPLQFQKQEHGAKRTAVVHKAARADNDMCRPIIEGPSPPLKSEWEYLGKVMSSCPCRQSDTEW